ncbi:internalin A [Ruminiclostridium sufflavum DSM 19573]|uniref:Internalin A n=1 Tax=Ruminiclostridium sufflavum DSM 19573 TaxID=1121337 RepID=A0A318XQA7_9FIRM|nr:leucine-rich repeat domain-containing protein [Ruminiclostridium sufflavum]PYG87999.1 internalin A [Ruminiclostridium sufflavum DSM 19573]
MRIIKKAISAIVVLAILLSMVGGLEQNAQAAVQQKLELHAFYPAQLTFSEQAEKYIDSLDSISFAWGRMYSDLSEGINTTLGQNGNTMFYYPKDYIEVLKYTKSKNKSMQLNIFSDSVNAQKIFPYEQQRAEAISAISDLMKKDVSEGGQIYFDGVVIDVEGLQNKDLKGNTLLVNQKTIGSWYVQFLKELKAELAKINKKMFVAVNPLLNYTGYDYKGIAAAADKMIVMAHDYEPVTKLNKTEILQYTGYNCINPIDSLAPIKKIQTAMEDVKKNVSKADLKKVMLQISFDAAQWRFSVPAGASWDKTGKLAMSMEERNTPTYQMIYARIQNKDGKGTGMTYGYNNELQSPFIQYMNISDKTYNILLYENSRSIKAKIDMVKQYGLGGISLWSLSNVPDYSDKTAKAYGLDVWSSILNSLEISSAATKETAFAFKDKVIENAVKKQLLKTSGTVCKSDLGKVYRLAVPAGVKTLVDLKQLSSLEYLDLSNTGITDISALSSLKNLRVLYLQRNSIAHISPLKGITKLEILSINGNKISSISALSSLTQLSELYIRDNKITSYNPIAGLKKLRVLYLKGNVSVNYACLKSVKPGLSEFDF